MTIPLYTDDLPNRSTQPPAVFSANWDTLLPWIAYKLPVALNALAVGAISSGTTNALEIMSDGTAAAPVVRFNSEPTTGFYRIGAGQWGLSILGSLKHSFSATEHLINGFAAYTKSTAIGTVSHDGTNNTGAVIETGSNANGSFTKFADGTMICRHRMTANSGADTTWTFPVAFNAAPTVQATGEGAFSVMRLAQLVGVASTTAVDFNVISAASNRTAGNANLLAIGRWRA